MTGRTHLIVVLRCMDCGIEIVGKLRNGLVYATNHGRPDDARVIEGKCPAHGQMVVSR
jgi:hypothetical protein